MAQHTHDTRQTDNVTLRLKPGCGESPQGMGRNSGCEEKLKNVGRNPREWGKPQSLGEHTGEKSKNVITKKIILNLGIVHQIGPQWNGGLAIFRFFSDKGGGMVGQFLFWLIRGGRGSERPHI